MEKINVTQAARNLSELLNKVAYQGVSFELERGNKVIARLIPARTASPMKAKDLNDFFVKLLPLGDDAKNFSRDIEDLEAKLPPEPDHGQLIGVHDLLIAATAISHGCAVLTANVKEFDCVPGLEVVGLSAQV